MGKNTERGCEGSEKVPLALLREVGLKSFTMRSFRIHKKPFLSKISKVFKWLRLRI